MTLHIVLFEPEIPANTGNIARTCAATGAHLHLIKPLGFSTDDKYLKRAGLDYWHAVNITYYDSFDELVSRHDSSRFYFATTKATSLHTDIQYRDGDFIVFGKESAGLPQEILDRYPSQWIRLPMLNVMRSLNLSNAAAVILYESLRQLDFPDMK